jgi:hypothetical protein
VRLKAAALLALICAAAAGCGGGGDDSSSSSSSSAASESNGIASKSPQQILDASANALKDVKTFHVEGTQGKSTSVKADVGLPDQFRFNLRQGRAAALMLLTGGSLYIKANDDYWKQVGGNARGSGQLAGRWFKLPSENSQLQLLTKQVDPKVLSRCLREDHGTLANGGTATVNGQPAVVVIDKGDKPGTARGKLFVAATGDPLPLRTLATGSERPGGAKTGDCEDSTPTQAGDEAVFSRYDEPVDLKPPPSAVDLGNAGGASS